MRFLVWLSLATAALGTATPSTSKTYHSLLDNVWLYSETNSSVSSDWRPVSLPFTWNALDGQSGGEYRRGSAWFRTLVLVPDLDESRLVLDVGAASSVVDVFANEIYAGSHRGGFSRFRVDLTLQAKQAQQWRLCTLLLRVDNAKNISDVLPLHADFPAFGGLFRDIGYWVIQDHVPVLDLLYDLGSPGVRFRQTNALSKFAPRQGLFEAVVSVGCFGNLSESSTSFALKIKVLERGIPVVAVAEVHQLHASCLFPASFTVPFTIPKPRVWNGRIDPFLYTAIVDIEYKNIRVDSFTTKIGVRTYHVDSQKGFFLNGSPYSLHGVNLHQDWANLGWAITPSHTLQNFHEMNDLKITALRCAHYQHSEYTYSLADAFGIVVWAEIPNIGAAPANPAVFLNAGMQLRELIRQAGGHASIVVWGIASDPDVGNPKDSFPYPLVWALSSIAKAEDPYRLTTMAVNTDLLNPIISLTDSVAVDLYDGWSNGTTINQTGRDLDKYHSQNQNVALGISEYGAGASIAFHSDDPVPPDHTEEYQALLHEGSWPQIREREYLWWKTVMSFADFASGGKQREGDRPGRNDKGLVTFDRRVRKDAFWYYKAVWNSETPFAHVTASRFRYRVDIVDVKVYATGVESVALFVNGVEVGRMEVREDKVHVWRNVRLREGVNRVQAQCAGGVNSNMVTWFHVGTKLQIQK
ncbi:hypothetical protein HDU98_011980 [Podochytrium sp. JEL0797]|nr:hypothetical protein HDU98_011980 [Podochytrium sp. JEL0797]